MFRFSKIVVAGTIIAICMRGMVSYATETGTITTMSEKIYSEMDDNSNVVGNVISGNSFSILGVERDAEGTMWYKVQTNIGAIGYIRVDKVSSSAQNEDESGLDEQLDIEFDEMGQVVMEEVATDEDEGTLTDTVGAIEEVGSQLVTEEQSQVQETVELEEESVTVEEDIIAETNVQEDNVETVSKSEMYIDWVAVFSFIGIVLCLGMISRMLKTIKNLGIGREEI